MNSIFTSTRILSAMVAVLLLVGCTAGEDGGQSSDDDRSGGGPDGPIVDDDPIDEIDPVDENGEDGNGDDSDDNGGGSPLYSGAVVDPDRILIEPDVVAPGGTANVFFPQETERGVYFALEERTGDGWDHVFHLSSGEEIQGGRMSWEPVDGREIVSPGVAVHGPGPDVLPIPETAVPGAYRICTRLGEDAVCAELTIED